jgi:hypothetical protein
MPKKFNIQFFAADHGERTLEQAMRERFMTLEAITTIRSLETIQPRYGPTLFPTRSVPTLNYKYWIEEQERYAMATFQSFDAEARQGYLPGHEAEWINLAKVSIKFSIFESDIIEFQDAGRTVREEFLDRLERQIHAMTMGCRERQEALEVEIASTGRVDIRENNVVQKLDFNVPADQRTTLGGTSAWSDLENSNPLLDIQGWMLLMNRDGRTRPTRLLTTARVKNNILMNKNIKLQIFGTEGATRMVTNDQLDALFASLGLPQIITYDRMSYILTDKGTLSQFRPFREGLAVLLPPNPLGEMLEGPTVEELQNGISGITAQNRSGLMYSIWAYPDPPVVWHKTVLTCFPTFTQSKNVFIADVMREVE